MSVQYLMPDASAVKSVFGMVFGDEVAVDSCDTPDLEGQYQATYIDREDKLVALCYGDLELVAFSGAALSIGV